MFKFYINPLSPSILTVGESFIFQSAISVNALPTITEYIYHIELRGTPVNNMGFNVKLDF